MTKKVEKGNKVVERRGRRRKNGWTINSCFTKGMESKHNGSKISKPFLNTITANASMMRVHFSGVMCKEKANEINGLFCRRDNSDKVFF